VALGLVVVLSHVQWRRELFANFQPPPPSLKTSQEFQAFLSFHGTVCAMWNEVIQQSMQSDQTTLSQPQYVQQLEQAQKPPVPLLRCDTALSDDTPPDILLTVMPTSIDVYANTLTFLNTTSTGMLTKLEGALQGNIEGFAPFQATLTCNQNGSSLTCSGSVPDASGSDPSGSDPSRSNPVLIAEILQRAATINEAVPDVQAAYASAQANIAKLKDYSNKAQNGTLINEVNIPSS
jgi:hypothetical protein